MGITDFALACGSEPVVDAVYSAIVGSIRSGHVLDTDREDLKDDDSVLLIHHCRTREAVGNSTSCHIATWFIMRPPLPNAFCIIFVLLSCCGWRLSCFLCFLAWVWLAFCIFLLGPFLRRLGFLAFESGVQEYLEHFHPSLDLDTRVSWLLLDFRVVRVVGAVSRGLDTFSQSSLD